MRTRRPCLLSASRRGVSGGDKGYNTDASARVNTLVRKIRESGRLAETQAEFDEAGRRKRRWII
jgi:hypothetical protein